jgi:hypothetical protein
MTSDTNYAGARAATRQAATDLHGEFGPGESRCRGMDGGGRALKSASE